MQGLLTDDISLVVQNQICQHFPRIPGIHSKTTDQYVPPLLPLLEQSYCPCTILNQKRRVNRSSSLHDEGRQRTPRLLRLTCLLRLYEHRVPEAAALSTPRTD
jgi:hypothetical protein